MELTNADEVQEVAVPEAIERQCLRCQTSFDSTWAGERICRQCKSTAEWRNSGHLEGV